MDASFRATRAPFVIRRASADDADAVAALYSSLSASSSARRFGQFAPPELLAATADKLRRNAVSSVIAVGDEGLIGEARWEAWSEHHEVSVAVVDAAQSRGVGNALLGALLTEAAREGIGALRGVVELDNSAAWRLVSKLGAVVIDAPADGQAYIELATDAPRPGWSATRQHPLKVLIEQRSIFPIQATVALQAAGFEVRHCLGPSTDEPCPLLVGRGCRLFEDADLVCLLLPEGDEARHKLSDMHERMFPKRPVARSTTEWTTLVKSLLAHGHLPEP